MKFTEIPISEIPIAIAQGRVVAGSVNEPVLSAALDDKSLRSLGAHFGGIAPRFMYTAWFTTKTYAAANPAIVKTVGQTLRKASDYVNGHHAQTIDLIAKFTSLEPGQVQKMTRVEQGTSLDVALVQPVIDAMVKYKFSREADRRERHPIQRLAA